MTDAAADIAHARALLASCRAVLLDMNGTFMFGEDRLGPHEDFGATYRALGGSALPDAAVAAAVRSCVAHMGRLYEDPARFDDFPGVREAIATLDDTASLPDAERERIADVIARHELGTVPDAYADAVRRLARSHRLALVTTIWAPKGLWLAELARAGLDDAFAARVFSSDSRSVKPSRRPFEEALRALGMDTPEARRAVVHVGDSLRCDVAGARAAGLRTIWIDRAGAGVPAGGPVPDARVPDLLALVR